MGMIACPNCGMQVNADAAGCQNCGANPKTGVVPEWVQAHDNQFAEHVERPQPDEPKRSRFFALPATLLGRVSAGLFLGVLVVFVASIIFDATGHDFSLTIGSVNVVLPIVVVAVCGMIVTGAVALIRYHERSWAVWVSTLLVVLVMGTEMVTALMPHSIPTARLSSKTAYVVAYDGGFWFEAGGDVNAPTAVGHDAGTPIPADYDVVIATGWVGTSLDQIEDMSQNIKMRVPEAGIDMSYDRGVGGPSDSTAFGSGPTLYDQYWVKLLFPITGFKPQSGSQVYAGHWAVPLTSGEFATNLDADGKLPQGTYTVYYEETTPQPMTGLDGIYDGQKTPYHARPGTHVAARYTFTVGPPAASPGPAASSSPAVSTSPSAGRARAAVSYAQPAPASSPTP